MLGKSERTIRIVVGFPPGGSTDAIARIVSVHLEKPLNARVIVDNRPGAGARIANTYVKSAKPDGNTLLLTSSSLMAVYPHIFNKLGYDALRDFVPVTPVVNMEFGYAASTAGAPGVRTLREYVQWVKSNPSNGNYGAVGSGSIPHFLGFLLGRAGGVQLNHVPFNGAAPHLQALNGGRSLSASTSQPGSCRISEPGASACWPPAARSAPCRMSRRPMKPDSPI